MKKLIFAAGFFAIALFFSVGTVAAQDSDDEVGGYRSTQKNNAEVVKAVNFAIAAKSKSAKMNFKLSEIHKAKIQIVAGMNYLACISVYVPKAGEANEPFTVEVVVYKNLQGEYSLTQWKEVEDCDSDGDK